MLRLNLGKLIINANRLQTNRLVSASKPFTYITEIHSLIMGRSMKRARFQSLNLNAQQTASLQTAPNIDANVNSSQSSKFTDVTFEGLPLLQESKRALAKMGYTHCTQIQAASLPLSLAGSDLLNKARTGTGKTLAFLLPAVEQLMKSQSANNGKISILVISPTRELASQIESEAKALAYAHKLTTQCVVGGTNVQTDVKKLRESTPHILVGTPGRLIDLLENSILKGQLQQLRTFVLDEADRLLDMGFRPEIEKIIKRLPPASTRQNVMFSATYPENIQSLCRDVLRPGYEIVDTVGESSIQTAEKVEQKAIVATMKSQMANLYKILDQHRKEDSSFKVMVFFTTARLTALYASVFGKLGFPVLELHSRKSQAQRTRVAEQFRRNTKTILFSSDVSARGVDYPDVSLVVQVGLPSDRDQYIHRVGRTARAGKNGQAIILLQDFERRFLSNIRDLPVQEQEGLSSEEINALQPKIDQSVGKLDEESISKAYQAWLGFYNTHLKSLRWTQSDLVSYANAFATDALGCEEPPALLAKTVGKMGLKSVPGLRIQKGSQVIKNTREFGDTPSRVFSQGSGRSNPRNNNQRSQNQSRRGNSTLAYQEEDKQPTEFYQHTEFPRSNTSKSLKFSSKIEQPKSSKKQAKRVYDNVDW